MVKNIIVVHTVIILQRNHPQIQVQKYKKERGSRSAVPINIIQGTSNVQLNYVNEANEVIKYLIILKVSILHSIFNWNW